MMRAQVVLTSAESKKVIAKSVVKMEAVKKAFREGLLVIHPSSSTYFIPEELTGKKPEGIWLVGMIAPRGACVEGLTLKVMEEDKFKELSDPANFPFSWVFRKGRLEMGTKLMDVLREMKEGDVYIKGINAVDTHGYVGVLLASLAGGTIGKVLAAQRERKFETLYLGGLEKLLPGSIQEVAKETGRANTADALGVPCGLLPIKGKAVSEVEAFKTLFEVEAFPISAGGVGGAEGAVMLVLKGEEDRVRAAMKSMHEEIKGTKLPKVIMAKCGTCHLPGCCFAGKKIAWDE